MAPRTKRSKNASAKMAAQVAAGLAPWTRTAGFIANRLKVLEAELQASQTQHGTDAAASQQREQQLQAQIEELQKPLSTMQGYCYLNQPTPTSQPESAYYHRAIVLLVAGLCAQAGAGAIGFDSKGDNLGIIMQFALPMRYPAPANSPSPTPANPPSPTPANPPSPTITSQPIPARPARVIRRPSRFATDSPLLTPPPPNTPCLPSSLSQGSASASPSTPPIQGPEAASQAAGCSASPNYPAVCARDTGILTPAMEQLLSRYYRATHMTNAVPETMLKQLNNDSVLRMNAEGMSGRAKLAMEDTTAWVADGVVTQQGMVAATAERKALQNHGATAIPGTAASTGGTAASPSGTAASPGGTAASPGGTAAIPGGTAASPGGTAASPGGTAASPGGGTQALATNKARLGKRQQQAQSKAERVMKRIRCLVSMPSDEQRATVVAVRDSVTARQQQQQVDSKRLKELEDTARGVYNRFEPPLPALRSKGMTVEELKHLSQKLGVGSVGKNRRQLLERIAEYCKQ
ncbi:hypothetical protein QJQ45_025833 [Haematococcus lacustris]|nr:hypothetical protein QJQ45_025833 [Haematococcus lacustris]